MLDDIQFLAGKTGTQEALSILSTTFINTKNKLYSLRTDIRKNLLSLKKDCNLDFQAVLP